MPTDLPLPFDRVIKSAARMDFIEAVGFGPESEQVVSSTLLLADDQLSTDTFGLPLYQGRDGLPGVSCERWLRARFTPPFGTVSNFRIWASNLDPNSGWSLMFGTRSGYMTPTRDLSGIAIQPMPLTDPGGSQPNLPGGPVVGSATGYTDWMILQAVWDNATPGPMQSTPIMLNLRWVET